MDDRATLRRAFLGTLAAVIVVVSALALWKLKVLIALLFVAFTISAAMRPGVDALARRHVPRAVGVLIHYIVLIGLFALLLAFAVPQMIDQVEHAVGTVQSGKVHTGSSFQDHILAGLERRLKNLPKADRFVHPAITAGEKALAVLVGVFFTFASAAYWLFERDRAIDLVTGFLPRPRRKKVRDTWILVDLKLGAFVRGQILMIAIIATLVSAAFWAVGEPYWLLLGILVALLEIIPVVGPLLGLIIAVAAGLSVDWQTAAKAGGALLAIRVFQDYVINPKVMGGIVGLSPLIVMTSAIAVTTLFGPFYVLLSVPIASLIVTVVDVAARGVDPAEAEVPTVLFPAGDVKG
jgi:predicted PurR-regulated permease PerM